MNGRELALRKELAVTRMRVARAEMALARSRRPSSLTTVSAAVDLASALLEGRDYGKWSDYTRIFLRVARLVLGMRPSLPARSGGRNSTTKPRRAQIRGRS